MSSRHPATVLIVDDHPLLREGLAARIDAQPDLAVCGQAATSDEAIEMVRASRPALVIVDLALKAGHGLDLIAALHKEQPATRMLVLSAYEDSLFAERALRAGAHGYMHKQEAQEKVIVAIRSVLRGERYVSAEIADRLLEQALAKRPVQRGVHNLSNRELEVFELIGHGKSTREIAEHLGLSVHTVETHRENIRSKLAVAGTAELARRAVEWVLRKR